MIHTHGRHIHYKHFFVIFYFNFFNNNFKRMKKLRLLCVAMAALLCGSASADVVNDYKVDFNTAISTSAHDFSVAVAWGHVVSSYFDYDEYETYYATYTYQASAGIDGSGALEVAAQDAYGSGWSTGSTTDLIVTPPITGASSIYVKKTKSSGTVKFYTVTKSGSTYTKGSQITLETTPALSTEEFVKVEIPAQDGAYIGIYGSSVIFDDFEAAQAEIVANRTLKISKVTKETTTVACDETNHFPVAMQATILNNGDVTLNPGDEGYSLSIANQSKGLVAVSTTPIEVSLAPGESTTVDLVASVDYNTYPDRNRYDVVENISGTNVFGGWWDVTPYKPILKVRDNSNGIVNSGTALAFGMITEPVSKTYKIQNTGAAPMHIESVTLPEGFTSSVSGDTTIDSNGELEWTITFNASEYGIYGGDIILKITDIADDFVLPVTGTLLDSSKYFINFENNSMPDGVLNLGGTSWKLFYINYTGNKVCLESTSYSPSYMFVLPLLKVEEGEKMSIDIAERSSNSFAKIYYSADRSNWTLAKEVTADDLIDPTGSSYSSRTYNFTTVVIDNIPAGNWYIAIESGYTYVDNIYGFERVPVDNDVVLQSFSAPATAVVNYEMAISASVLNINNVAVAADSYTATLYVGDEAVATAAETPEIAANGTANFQFAFTPHSAGDVTTHFELAIGDYKVTSDPASISVANETASKEFAVGSKTGTSSNLPFTLNYCNSETECIYTADVLGLSSGAKIASLCVNGSKSADLTTKVTVYLQNTDDASTASSGTSLCDVSAMTKVYEGDYTFKKGETKLFNITFNEPFEYTGSNIRIVFVSEASSYSSASFDVFKDTSGHIAYRYADSGLSGKSFSTYVSNLPVLNLQIVSEPMMVSGRVVKVDGTPVADANVALTSGNVLYSATTDAEGSYTATVFQADKTYSATLTAGDVEKTKSEISFAEGNVVANFILPGTIALESGKKAAMCLPEYPDDENLVYFEISNVQGSEVTLSKTETPVFGVPYIIIPLADVNVEVTDVPDTEDAGAAGIGSVKLQGTYDFITVASDAAGTIYSLLNNDFTKVEAATEILPMRAFIVADGDYTFTFDNDPTGAELVGVDSVAGNADVYNLQGQRVGKASDIRSLEKGIYIVNGKKIALTK